jgi:hypothetical protein
MRASAPRWPGDTFEFWPDTCPTGEHKYGYCCLACDHEEDEECCCAEVMASAQQITKALAKNDMAPTVDTPQR